jgi:formylglycine-generating enzyme required for sulfatase activity
MDEKLKVLLKKEKLEHLQPLFVEQGITDSILGDLSDGDLRDLGIDKLGERKRLLAAFQGASGGDSSLGAMLEVEGGTLPKASELAGAKVASFEIGKFAVTMEEWQGVRSWAVANGFGFEVGESGGPKHPVTMINWYDCVKWCNAKSLMEGLDPVYGVKEKDGYYCREEFGRDGSENVVLKPRANGYRLPTEAEWGWAARGGRNTQSYTFAGSNNLNAVGWYGENSGGAAHAVGEKTANELGLHDMSGNVWEWCWDLVSSFRRGRGGCWNLNAEDCAVGSRYNSGPGDLLRNIGFRLARSSGK